MRSRFNSKAELKLLSRAATERYGVGFTYFGMKEVAGRKTRRATLVCVVPRKRKLGNISRHERIPKCVSVKCDGGRCCINTDVIELRARFRTTAMLNPGDTARGGGYFATLGAFGAHRDFGEVFVTAGHFVAQTAGGAVSLFDNASNSDQATGRFRDHEFHDGIDYALISADANTTATLSNAPLDSVYEPVAKRDIGRTVYVVARGKFLRTECRGIDATIGPPYHPTTLRHMILTDIVNRPGDSGAALIDSDYRIWGFLSGVFNGRYSIFMPAVRLLSRQNLALGET